MNVTQKEAVVLQYLRAYPFSSVEVHVSNGQPARLFVRKSTLLKEGESIPTSNKVTIEKKKNGVTQVIAEEQIVIDFQSENNAFDVLTQECMMIEPL